MKQLILGKLRLVFLTMHDWRIARLTRILRIHHMIRVIRLIRA
jgi:hypothetical protein